MEAYQQRAVDEKTELDEKIVKLDQFIEGDVFKTLPTDEQARLVKQLHAMHEYFSILGERAAAFRS